MRRRDLEVLLKLPFILIAILVGGPRRVAERVTPGHFNTAKNADSSGTDPVAEHREFKRVELAGAGRGVIVRPFANLSPTALIVPAPTSTHAHVTVAELHRPGVHSRVTGSARAEGARSARPLRISHVVRASFSPSAHSSCSRTTTRFSVATVSKRVLCFYPLRATS